MNTIRIFAIAPSLACFGIALGCLEGCSSAPPESASTSTEEGLTYEAPASQETWAAFGIGIWHVSPLHGKSKGPATAFEIRGLGSDGTMKGHLALAVTPTSDNGVDLVLSESAPQNSMFKIHIFEQGTMAPPEVNTFDAKDKLPGAMVGDVKAYRATHGGLSAQDLAAGGGELGGPHQGTVRPEDWWSCPADLASITLQCGWAAFLMTACPFVTVETAGTGTIIACGTAIAMAPACIQAVSSAIHDGCIPGTTGGGGGGGSPCTVVVNTQYACYVETLNDGQCLIDSSEDPYPYYGPGYCLGRVCNNGTVSVGGCGSPVYDFCGQ